MTRLTLNGDSIESAAATLAALLEERGLATTKCATAVNEAFVPAAARASHPLHPGDRVEIVIPTQGG